MDAFSYKTKKELEEISADLEKLLLDMRGTRPEKLEEHIRKNYDSSFLELISSTFPNALDKTNGNLLSNVEEVLNMVNEKLKNSKEIKLTLAFHPDKKFMTDIQIWLARNVGEDFLLDIEIDKNVLGGSVISYEGKFKDYSVASKLKDYEQFIQ